MCGKVLKIKLSSDRKQHKKLENKLNGNLPCNLKNSNTFLLYIFKTENFVQ